MEEIPKENKIRKRRKRKKGMIKEGKVRTLKRKRAKATLKIRVIRNKLRRKSQAMMRSSRTKTTGKETR